MAVRAQPFGRDTSATDSIQAGRTVTGARLVAQAIYRRLITARGQLLDDPDYGLSLTHLLGVELTRGAELALASRLRNEIEKDARVESTNVQITKTVGTRGDYEFAIDVTTAEGPFELVLAASDVKVTILSLPEDS